MKKFLSFALRVVVLFAVSLMCNWIFSKPEHIGETLISSILTVLICSAIFHFVGKGRKES